MCISKLTKSNFDFVANVAKTLRGQLDLMPVVNFNRSIFI